MSSSSYQDPDFITADLPKLCIQVFFCSPDILKIKSRAGVLVVCPTSDEFIGVLENLNLSAVLSADCNTEGRETVGSSSVIDVRGTKDMDKDDVRNGK